VAETRKLRVKIERCRFRSARYLEWWFLQAVPDELDPLDHVELLRLGLRATLLDLVDALLKPLNEVELVGSVPTGYSFVL